MLVNLIGYNGYVVTSGDVENVKYMVAAEHGAARIRWIIYNNRRRRLVDLLLQVVQIDFPTELRLETILILIRYTREKPFSNLHLSLFFLSMLRHIVNRSETMRSLTITSSPTILDSRTKF